MPVTLFTEIGNAAMRERHMDGYRLWVALRYQDQKGGSYVPMKDVIKAGQACGWTRSYIYRIVKNHMGLFWTDEGDGLRYSSWRKLVDLLGLQGAGSKITIHERYLYDGMTLFKAASYAANFVRDTWRFLDASTGKAAGGKTISRALLTKLTGVTRQTQYKYEKMMGITVEHQYVFASVDAIEHLPIADRLPTMAGVRITDVDGDGKRDVVWQTANRYSTSNMRADFSGRAKNRGTGSVDTSGDAGPRTRVFYDNGKTPQHVGDNGCCVVTNKAKKAFGNGRYFRFVK